MMILVEQREGEMMSVKERQIIDKEDVGQMSAEVVLDEKLPLTQVITAITGGDVAMVDGGIDEDFGEFEGAGLKDLGFDELAMPFLIVLQSGSPMVKKGPLHVDGAEEGMFYNQATGRLYDGEKGVPFVPVDREHRYVEYFPREDDGSGGGFVGIRQPDDELVIRLRSEQGQFGKLVYEEGVEGEPTELNETYTLIGWVVPDWDVSNASRVVVPFASTKINGYKRFMSAASDIKYLSAKTGKYVRPPMFAHRYILHTVFKQKGTQSWYVIDVRLAESTKEESFIPAKHPLRALGEELHRSFNSGATRIAYERMEAEVTGTEGDGKDVPF